MGDGGEDAVFVSNQVEFAAEIDTVKIEGKDLFELAVILAGAFGDDGDTQTFTDHLLDGFGGADFNGGVDILEIHTHFLKKCFCLQTGAAAGLAADESLAL